MSRHPEEQDLNRAYWDERAGFHLDTEFYQRQVRRLSSGGHSLLPLEVRELGDISGLDVLHLQCHVGTDTLSLARLGANVTGVDFSRVAVDRAAALSKTLGIRARFEQMEIRAAGEHFAGQFDLVFTSYGVISWLPDLDVWASSIVRCLRPGGRFYIVEMHPLAFALADDLARQGDGLALAYPYLSRSEPLQFDEPGSYADRERLTTANSTREWSWSLADVITALLGAGLELQWLREHADGFYPQLPDMRAGEDGHYRLPEPLHGRYPLTFSILATLRADGSQSEK